MANIKEDALERRESVIVLYLTGNVPEKISEKLAMPAKTVKSDLKHMGIEYLEDSLKSEKQVKIEARQEIELAKQELWSMYMDSGKTEEKIKIISEIRELISKKIETLERADFSRSIPTAAPVTGDRLLWKDLKDKVFGNMESGNSTVQKKVSREIPRPEFEVIDILPESSCIPPNEKNEDFFSEELPTKTHVYPTGFTDECEKDPGVEIINLLKNIEKPGVPSRLKTEKGPFLKKLKIRKIRKSRK
jgi:hypothetical protein